MIKTESYLTYTIGKNGAPHIFQIYKSVPFEDEFLKIEQNVLADDFSDEYNVRITLRQNVSISLAYILVYQGDGTESTESCNNVIPVFTQKYFAPVLKEIKTSAHSFILHANRNYAVDFKKLRNGFELRFILDAAFMHPAWDLSAGWRSSADEIQNAGTVYTCDFFLFCDPANELLPLIPVIYPHGHSSGFILTDHCDFDTAAKLKLFLYGNNNNGWLGNNLKITKGVFTLSSRSKEFDKNDSLEDEGYFSLIQKLHEDGSEIAPHALKSKGQLDSKTFHTALKKLDTLFAPSTWIDHGSYLKYCYSQGGKHNPDFRLVESLKKYSYQSLWSFFDINIDALHTLNIFCNKKFSNSLMWKKAAQLIIKGKWMIAAHYCRSILHRNYKKNIVSDFLKHTMSLSKNSFIKWKTDKKKIFGEIKNFFSSLVKFPAKRNKESLPYDNENLLKYSDAVFLEERRPLAQYRTGDMLMFSTFETTHVKDIYNEAALNNLIAEYGLHIGHTYILNDLPYLNNIFADEKVLTLSDEWISFTKALSKKVKDKIIWNPTMGEFIQYLIAILMVRLRYRDSRTVEIFNQNTFDIRGFTFIMPSSFSAFIRYNGSTVAASKTDKHFHFFVVDLPAQKKIILSGNQ